MFALWTYWNRVWRDTLHHLGAAKRPNSFEERAAFARQLGRTPRLIFSTDGYKWTA